MAFLLKITAKWATWCEYLLKRDTNSQNLAVIFEKRSGDFQKKSIIFVILAVKSIIKRDIPGFSSFILESGKYIYICVVENDVVQKSTNLES